MSDDSELERLKAKRLAEMQKNISSQKQQQPQEPQETKKEPTPREILVNNLGFRGLEVLENSESQFPNETKMVVNQIATLIKAGELNEKLDGGQLLYLLRTVGLNVRMQTKINVEQDGKFVSLTDKLSTKKSEEE
ncbi:MAG: double-stranded DNA-binding protein [Nitrosopumilaceae archaeon]|nr:double-stranded DNA-binding protein [Nitrosopumilaceae archaeon]NIP10356.1 double-stranded DNA-binding protein [Nitrosopumilaceae archaeon]NIS94960.1 double-stranded DNA-binding protein [Nitrosopumilaceae archaeon]